MGGSNDITLRGYTFHEHLQHFSLINMNGRLYDYVLGRMLSPDNYVQSPNSSQSFNRYSYCWNNPLKYRDPSGEIVLNTILATVYTAQIDFLITGFLIGGFDPTSSAARNNAWAAFDPTMRGTKTNNAWRIDMGRFQTDADPNKNWAQKAWQIISRFTWEAPQSGLGNVYSHVRNNLGNVDRVDYWGGATFMTNENAKERDGISIGNYININHNRIIESSFEQHIINDPLFMHEYGHTFDSRIFGPAYLFIIGLPSIYSAATYKQVPNEAEGVTTHDFRWYEMRANRHAKKYFGERYGVDWDRPYPNRFSINTIETFFPTKRR